MPSGKRPWAFKRGDRGPAIIDAQEKLTRLGFDPGKPTGFFGAKTLEAIVAFQKANNLTETGMLDEPTLKLLFQLTAPEDYPEGLVKALGTQEEATIQTIQPPESPALWRRPADRPPAKPGARAIVISVGERALGLFEGAVLIRKYPVAIGRPETPTPLGTFRILEKVMHPGGALGSRWMAFTYERHGIHGTNAPWFIGQEVSHGCVRMYNENVEELYDMVEIGTPVVVIRSSVEFWAGQGSPPGTAESGAISSGTASGKPATSPPSTPTSGPSGPLPKDWEPGTAPQPGAAPQPGSPSLSPTPVPPTPRPPATPGPRTYVVMPGDTLWTIAREFGTTVDEIVRLNNIANPDLIYPGQTLKIP